MYLNRVILSTLILASLTACVSPASAPGIDSQAAIATLNLARNHQQSPIVSDQQPLHWAIDGVGYFAVIDTTTGERLLTRKGDFVTNANGQITTADGNYFLDPAITFPPGSAQYYIEENGAVWARLETKKNWTDLGRLTLTRVPYPDKLTALGGREGYFKVNQASGAQEEGQPGQNMFGRIVHGALEDFSVPSQSLPKGPCLAGKGTHTSTGKTLDLAIEGEGYFIFRNRHTGDNYVSRQGSFHIRTAYEPRSLTAEGMLLNQHGYDVEVQMPSGAYGPVILGVNQTIDRIDAQGHIWVKEAGESKSLGRLALAKLKDKTQFQAVGFARQNVYRSQQASNPDLERGVPGEQGLGRLKEQTLEDCGLDIFNYPKD